MPPPLSPSLQYTARGLFERHKLLLSLQICIRILQTANQVNTEEWQFFLKGGSVLDRSQQAANPAPTWISEASWDNLTELEDQLPNFKGIVNSYEQNSGEAPPGGRGLGDTSAHTAPSTTLPLALTPFAAAFAGEWERWYRQNEPEAAEMPSEWESKCNELQRMILVRCLRPDRVIFSATSYVANALGRKVSVTPGGLEQWDTGGRC